MLGITTWFHKDKQYPILRGEMNMYKVKVFVTLKESVVDPQGSAATKALQNSEFPEVQDVRVGKYIELNIEKSNKEIEETIHDMCKNLLVNTVVEDYRFEIEEVGAE